MDEACDVEDIKVACVVMTDADRTLVVIVVVVLMSGAGVLKIVLLIIAMRLVIDESRLLASTLVLDVRRAEVEVVTTA